MTIVPRLLRTRDAARHCGFSKSTFEKLRCRGGGPDFVRRGRSIFYALDDLELWLDAETHLPLTLRVLMKNPATQEHPITATSQSIQWNMDLDAKLFDSTPPDGYADNTPTPPKLEVK